MNFDPSRALVDQVRDVCRRLAPLGWGELFATHGLNLLDDDLANELARPLRSIDRSQPGFADFAHEGQRGIEPGKPALSLLFHAFASPQVTSYRSRRGTEALRGFPTLGELEILENYVYGVEPPSIEDLRALAGDRPLAIAVFACEYRPGAGTVHRKHADMSFSRAGIARVGTRPPRYIDEVRGFAALSEENARAVHVLPCRYAAYIAVLVAGEKGTHGPMRFLDTREQPSAGARRTKDAGLNLGPPALRKAVGDDSRSFWVPLHKLFEGNHCLRGYKVDLQLSAHHVNEKIRRAHLRFLTSGHFAGWTEPDISNPPFIIRSGIAEISRRPEDGSCLLVPEPHATLVKAAEYKGRPLTFLVPKSIPDATPWRAYQSSLNLTPNSSGTRSAPEYLHARHVVEEDGSERDLNKAPNVREVVADGNYRARHYVDYTGDGWIAAECRALALDIPRRLPAYSIVASPDFYPEIDQASLMRWIDQSVAPSVVETIWNSPGAGRPKALSDQRYAANLSLGEAGFDPHDDTLTAIIGAFGSGRGKQTRLAPPPRRRTSMLPDGAAGVFAPGWDISYDRLAESDPEDTGENIQPGVTFLANYGLGSPFPEDSMLCAALSSFWPAVAPDTTRTFAPGRNYATSTPLEDEVIGLGDAEPWDGVRGPVVDEAKKVVEYQALAYGDYVRAALENCFDYARIGRVTAEEYLARTLTMALVYQALGATTAEDKTVWSVLSFRRVAPGDAEFVRAQEEARRTLSTEHAYRYVMFKHDRGATRPSDDPAKFDKRLVDIQERVVLYADPTVVLVQSDANWRAYSG